MKEGPKEKRTATRPKLGKREQGSANEPEVSRIGRVDTRGCDSTVLIQFPFVEGKLRFLLDTGSEVSVIKQKFIPFGAHLRKRNQITLLGVSQKGIMSKGILKLPLGDRKEDFHVVGGDFKLDQDGIIGRNVLRDAIINFEEGYAIIKGVRYPLGASKAQIVRLKPRTETIVAVEVDKPLKEGIIEKQEVKPNILVASSLTKVDNYVGLVSMINLTEATVEFQCPVLQIHEVEEPKRVEQGDNSPQVMTLKQKEKTSSEKPRIQRVAEILRLGHLSKEDKETITAICGAYSDIFYLEGDKLTHTNLVQHRIRTPVDQPPINVRPYRIPEAHKEEVEKQISKMLNEDIIQESMSPWNSPLLLVPKRMDASGVQKWRVVIDYRKLNEVTIGMNYPLPLITELLDALGKAKYFSTLDLASGYYQILVHPEDREKTAFSALGKHYEYKRLPMGLKNSPVEFVRLMNNVLSGLTGIKCLCYLDDIIIFGSSVDEHNARLREIFQRLREHNLKLQPDKCEFLRPEINFLGHIITSEGVKPDEGKVKAVKEFPQPRTTRELKGFLGLSGYYRRFIPQYSKIAKPLYDLLKKDVPYEWRNEHEQAFQTLKEKLTTGPVLQYPDFEKPFILTTDSSRVALGAVLSQGELGKDLPVAYASRTLNKAERNYGVTELEMLAITWATRYFRPYLLGRHFTVVTDHKPLRWVFGVQDPSSRLLRFRLKLAEYDFEIVYKQGKRNCNADALSRIPIKETEPEKREVNVATASDKTQDDNELSQNVIEDAEETTMSDQEGSDEVEELELNLQADEKKEQETSNELTEEERKQIIVESHDSLIGGHQGINRTYARVKEYVQWPGMRKEIEDYIRSCPSCQMNKINRPETKARRQITDTPSTVFEKVSLDIVGPLPETETGEKYILTCQDHLSKYLIAIPIRNQETETIARALINHVISIFGIPSIILTDQGSNFMSHVFRKLCRTLRIQKIHTTAFRPQSNGALERSHRVLIEYLRHYICRNTQADWHKYLPLATFVYNTTRHSSTQFTPYELIFGRKANLPGILQKPPPEPNYNEYEDFVEELTHRLQETQQLARKTLIKAKEKEKKTFDKQENDISFKPGDMVLLRDESIRRGRSRKLSPPFIGPYVIEGISGVNCKLRINKRGKTMTVHKNRLKLYI